MIKEAVLLSLVAVVYYTAEVEANYKYSIAYNPKGYASYKCPKNYRRTDLDFKNRAHWTLMRWGTKDNPACAIRNTKAKCFGKDGHKKNWVTFKHGYGEFHISKHEHFSDMGSSSKYYPKYSSYRSGKKYYGGKKHRGHKNRGRYYGYSNKYRPSSNRYSSSNILKKKDHSYAPHPYYAGYRNGYPYSSNVYSSNYKKGYPYSSNRYSSNYKRGYPYSSYRPFGENKKGKKGKTGKKHNKKGRGRKGKKNNKRRRGYKYPSAHRSSNYISSGKKGYPYSSNGFSSDYKAGYPYSSNRYSSKSGKKGYPHSSNIYSSNYKKGYPFSSNRYSSNFKKGYPSSKYPSSHGGSYGGYGGKYSEFSSHGGSNKGYKYPASSIPYSHGTSSRSSSRSNTAVPVNFSVRAVYFKIRGVNAIQIKFNGPVSKTITIKKGKKLDPRKKTWVCIQFETFPVFREIWFTFKFGLHKKAKFWDLYLFSCCENLKGKINVD